MAGSSLLVLIDDIAAVLDDVARRLELLACARLQAQERDQ